jgi:hypothetical protein
MTQNEQTTQVQFGTDKIGSIGLTGKRGCLVMQQLKNEVMIGQPFDIGKDITELPKVVLNFTEISSVEALIKTLEKVKEKMSEPEFPPYAYAC